MVSPARPTLSFEEYLRIEEDSRIKHEFFDGLVWAMAGGTPEHGAIAGNIIMTLGPQLRDRPCRVFTSDVRIRVKATGLCTYPDVSIVCGTQETDPEDKNHNTIINPRVIVEVLSPSTEAYDRGEKLNHYKKLASLEEIILVAHEEKRLEVWRRQEDHWSLEVVRGAGSIALRSIESTLDLADVYRNPLE